MNKLIETAKELDRILESGIEILPNSPIHEKLKQALNIACVTNSQKLQTRKSGDFDIWYKPCEKCGYDTAKSTKPREGNKTCWKCGTFVSRDYSARALKAEFQ